MRRAIGLLSGLALTVSLGTARADEPRKKVRPSVTVEVIDDAHHVDDIISRMKAAPPNKDAKAVAPQPQPPAEHPKVERPPLRTDDAEATKAAPNRSEKSERRDRRDRDRRHRR